MDAASLFDASAAAIVVGGTLLSTVLRSGLTDCRHALAALGGLGRKPFDAPAVRAELAAQLRDIHTDGLLRAEPHRFADREFDEAADALIASRSLGALHEAHATHRARRQEQADRAVRALSQSSEMAPVFGLAGTLIGLSQLPAEGLAQGSYATTISLAVLTTLYGLLLANLVLAPLARIVDRRAQAEERARQEIVDWLAAKLEPEIPGRRGPSPVAEAA